MKDPEEDVVLVDENDGERGRMGKLAAHREGLLHRAISIFVFDGAGRLIIQRRADGKYHSAGLWANTCCSHPRPGETTEDAAHRRLREEMGFDCPLTYQARILYRADVGSDLVEHELVSAYVGRAEGPIAPDPNEVSEWRALDLAELKAELAAKPETFAPWFRIYVRDHETALFGAGAPSPIGQDTPTPPSPQ